MRPTNHKEEKKMLSVSVVICVHDRHEYLDEALESLRHQTLVPDEIIIVNDGSTQPSTLEYLNNVASQYPVLVLNTNNLGLAGARNLGRSSATSDVLVFLDDDDILGNNYLQKTVSFLTSHDSYSVVYTEAELFGETNEPWQLPEYNARRIVIENMVYAAAAIRTSTFDRVGGYDESLRNGREDHDLWIRITATGAKFKRLPGYDFFYRQTSSSMNHSVGESSQSLAKLYSHISRNSPDYYMENIDILWEELFKHAEDLRRYQRIYGKIDKIRRIIGNSGRAAKRYLLAKK